MGEAGLIDRADGAPGGSGLPCGQGGTAGPTPETARDIQPPLYYERCPVQLPLFAGDGPNHRQELAIGLLSTKEFP